MSRYVIGMGSNLGDRALALRTAVSRMKGTFDVLAVSSLYETAPVGGPDQPAYLNAAALIESDAKPGEILDHLLSIEASLGRVRRERWGPRTLDLDILWTDGEPLSTERLTIPHRRLNERRFALVPMLQLVPHAKDPATGSRYEVPEGDVTLYGPFDCSVPTGPRAAITA